MSTDTKVEYRDVAYYGIDPATLPTIVTDEAARLEVEMIVADEELPASTGGGLCITRGDRSIIIVIDLAQMSGVDLVHALAHELGHAADSRAGTIFDRDPADKEAFADQHAARLLGIDTHDLAHGPEGTSMRNLTDHQHVDPTARLLVLGGCAAIVVAAFLPWVTVAAPFVGTVSRAGIQGDGVLAVACAAVAFLGALPMVQGDAPTRGRLVLTGLFAIFAGLLCVEVATNVNAGIGDLGAAAIGQVGVGVYLTILAALAVVVGVAMQLRQPD